MTIGSKCRHTMKKKREYRISSFILCTFLMPVRYCIYEFIISNFERINVKTMNMRLLKKTTEMKRAQWDGKKLLKTCSILIYLFCPSLFSRLDSTRYACMFFLCAHFHCRILMAMHIIKENIQRQFALTREKLIRFGWSMHRNGTCT